MSVLDSKKRILISQPEPKTGSPYTDIVNKYGLEIDFSPFFTVEPVDIKDFRAQRINILDYTAIVFSSRTAIDAFFDLATKMRVAIPETFANQKPLLSISKNTSSTASARFSLATALRLR